MGVKERWLRGLVSGWGRQAQTSRSDASRGSGRPDARTAGRAGRAESTPAARGRRSGSCGRGPPGRRPSAPRRPSPPAGAEPSWRSQRCERREQRRAGREAARAGAAGLGWGVPGTPSPAPPLLSSPPSGPEERGAWTKPRCSGTMTPVRFVAALILGLLPEVVSSEPVLRYPLHHRHRDPRLPSPQSPSHLPTQQRPRRTPLSPLARAPRPPPAPGAQSPLALHAGRAIRPHPGGCPAGGPWVNVTDFGAPCLRWADVPPLLERSPPAGWAPLRGQRHNLCRITDGAGRPWCFYRNARGRGDWGYCACGHGHGERPREAGSLPALERAWGAPAAGGVVGLRCPG